MQSNLSSFDGTCCRESVSFLRRFKFPSHPCFTSTLYFDKEKYKHSQCHQTSVELLFKTVAPVLLIWKSLEKISQVNQEKLHHQQKSNLKTDLSIFKASALKHWAAQREFRCQGINMSVSWLLRLTGLRLYATEVCLFYFIYF